MLYHKPRSKSLYYSIGNGLVPLEFNCLINEDGRGKLYIALSVLDKEIGNFILKIPTRVTKLFHCFSRFSDLI